MAPAGSVSSCSMTSLAVSVAAQKNGGDSRQPIWRAVGTTNSTSSIEVVCDAESNTYVKFHASSFETTSCQNPSAMSVFASLKGLAKL